MRRTSWIAIIAAATTACASGGGGAGGGSSAMPATPAVSASESTGGTAACATGACKITVLISKDVSDQYNRLRANWKIYQGCPKLYGATVDDTTLAAALQSTPAFYSTQSALILVPSSMKGHIATVSLWFGSTPLRTVVVNLEQNPTPTIDFGLVPASASSSFQAAGSSSGGSSGVMGKGSKADNTGSSSLTSMTSSAASGILAGILQDDQSVDKKNQNTLHKICA